VRLAMSRIHLRWRVGSILEVAIMYQLQIYRGGWRDAFDSDDMLFRAITNASRISDAARVSGRLWRVIQVTGERVYESEAIRQIDNENVVVKLITRVSEGRTVWGEGAIKV